MIELYHGDSDEGHRRDATVAQRDRKSRTLQSGQGELVEDRFARAWRQFRRQCEARRIPQGSRVDLLRIVGALPGHRHAIAERAHQLFRQ
jgi:hypothetical protein